MKKKKKTTTPWGYIEESCWGLYRRYYRNILKPSRDYADMLPQGSNQKNPTVNARLIKKMKEEKVK